MIDVIGLELQRIFLVAPALIYALPAAAFFFFFNDSSLDAQVPPPTDQTMLKPAAIVRRAPARQYHPALKAFLDKKTDARVKVFSSRESNTQWVYQKWRNSIAPDGPPGLQLTENDSGAFPLKIFRGSLKFRAPPGEALS